MSWRIVKIHNPMAFFQVETPAPEEECDFGRIAVLGISGGR